MMLCVIPKRSQWYWLGMLICWAIPCHSATPFHPGESLYYDVRLWFGGRSGSEIKLGTAEFSVRLVEVEGKSVYQPKLLAKGQFLGQRYEVEYHANIDPQNVQTLLFSQRRFGSKARKKQLVFHKNKVSYWKDSRIRHADGSRGERRVLSLRWEHDLSTLTEPVYDLLSVLYRIRSFDLGAARDKAQSFVVVDGKDLWRLTVEAKKPELLQLPIGKISAIPIRLHTEPLNAHAKKSYQGGLYDLEGEIDLWLDQKQHRIVQVRGDLSVGFPMQAEMVLRKVGYANPPKLPF